MNGLWIASARPCGKGSTRTFARRLLMFRPDARLFCQHGASCDRKADPSHAMYSHELPQLPAAFPPPPADAEPPMSQIGPRVGGASVPCARPSQLSVHLCRDVCEIGFAPPPPPSPPPSLSSPPPPTTATDASSLPAGVPVLLYVHGFRQRFHRVTAALYHLRTVHEGVCVVGFLWPAHSHKASYVKARGKTGRAGRLLRNVIALLCERGCSVHLVGHSLGCRVVLSSLACGSPAAVRTGACPAVHVSSVTLLAAAVASDALADGGEFAASQLRTSLSSEARISVFSSANDDVLRDSFWYGEILQGMAALRPRAATVALGLHGVADGAHTQVPRGVDVVDITDEVANHSPHTWIASSRVASSIAALLQTGGDA